jgi:1,4-alpha-glucan branching enzyme
LRRAYFVAAHDRNTGTDSPRLATMRSLGAMYASAGGFWQNDASDSGGNVLSFLRYGSDGSVLACVCNFAAMPHHDYRIGLPSAGPWTELLNTDAETYGGSGTGNYGRVQAVEEPWHGRQASASISIPPLGVVWLVPEATAPG